MQNCNSTPFFTTDEGNPSIGDFPAYMVEDRFDDKRRAKVSRMLLREMHDVTFDDWKQAAFDTTLYWPLVNLPRLAVELKALDDDRFGAGGQGASRYLDHLLDWDCRSSIDSTQTTLCALWYEELYGRGYPVETLKAEFVDKPALEVRGAGRRPPASCKAFYGDWKVPWGDVSRMQRHANYADAAQDSLFRCAAEPALRRRARPAGRGVQHLLRCRPRPSARSSTASWAARSSACTNSATRCRPRRSCNSAKAPIPKSPHFMDQAAALLQEAVQARLVRLERRAGARQEQLSSGRGEVGRKALTENHPTVAAKVTIRGRKLAMKICSYTLMFDTGFAPTRTTATVRLRPARQTT